MKTCKSLKALVFLIPMLSLFTFCTRSISLISKFDVNQTFVEIKIIDIRPDHWSDSIVIRKSSFDKKIIASDSIWGLSG